MATVVLPLPELTVDSLTGSTPSTTSPLLLAASTVLTAFDEYSSMESSTSYMYCITIWAESH